MKHDKKFREALNRFAKKRSTTPERVLDLISLASRKNGIRAVSSGK